MTLGHRDGHKNGRANVNRTDELAGAGAKPLGGSGDGAPFVKWGDDYAWVEGKVLNLWTGQYGENARVSVTDYSEQLRAKHDKDTPAVNVTQGMEVNVGLNYAALEGIGPEQVGAVVHVAFEGWGETRAGNNFRMFKVYEITPSELKPEPEQQEPKPDYPEPVAVGPGAPGSEQPPLDDIPF